MYCWVSFSPILLPTGSVFFEFVDEYHRTVSWAFQLRSLPAIARGWRTWLRARREARRSWLRYYRCREPLKMVQKFRSVWLQKNITQHCVPSSTASLKTVTSPRPYIKRRQTFHGHTSIGGAQIIVNFTQFFDDHHRNDVPAAYYIGWGRIQGLFFESRYVGVTG